MGAMEWGGAEAHAAGKVAVDVAICKGGRAAGDAHATCLRARGTFPGNFFHGGHGKGRWRAAQRTYGAVFSKISQLVKVAVAPLTYTPPPCEHEGHFLDTSSMGAME